MNLNGLNFLRQIKESQVFVGLLMLHSATILLHKFSPFVDSAAHMQNAQVIKSLIFGDSATISQFYELNSEPVPNWTGHFLLSIFGMVFPAFVGNKIIHLFIILGFSLFFRRLIIIYNPDNKLLSYFIFPFVYSFTFFMGFYNFSLAIPLLFFAVLYWQANYMKPLSLKVFIVLSILIHLTYFSHILVFAILLLVLGLFVIVESLIAWFKKEIVFTKVLKTLTQKALFLVFASIYPLILFYKYFAARPSKGISVYLPTEELLNYLPNIRSIAVFNLDYERTPILLVFSAICFVLISVFWFYFKKRQPKSSETNFLNKDTTIFSWVWGTVTCLLLVLYFALPDSDGYAGYVSVRMNLLFFISLILWLSTQKVSKKILQIATVVLLSATFYLNLYYYKVMRDVEKVGQDAYSFEKFVPEGSVVLPLMFHDNWYMSHFSNFIGIEKPMVILENYEAGTGYFPVIWNKQMLPNTVFGDVNYGHFSCIYWHSQIQNPSKAIDFIFTMKSENPITDSCQLALVSHVNEHFTLVKESKWWQLHKLKNEYADNLN